MTGTLLKILETLPPAMRLQDAYRTWAVGDLVVELRAGNPVQPPPKRGRASGASAFVLHRCSDGRIAILRVEPTGSLARVASYLEVRA